MPNSNVWLKGDGSIPLTLEVQYSFIPVSGIQPTVEVLRYPDYAVADWSTSTFVPFGTASSGRGLMEEVPSGMEGLYKRDFNPGTFGEAGNRQIYFARFRATVPSGFREGVDEDVDLITHELEFFRPPASGLQAANQSLFATFCE